MPELSLVSWTTAGDDLASRIEGLWLIDPDEAGPAPVQLYSITRYGGGIGAWTIGAAGLTLAEVVGTGRDDVAGSAAGMVMIRANGAPALLTGGGVTGAFRRIDVDDTGFGAGVSLGRHSGLAGDLVQAVAVDLGANGQVVYGGMSGAAGVGVLRLDAAGAIMSATTVAGSAASYTEQVTAVATAKVGTSQFLFTASRQGNGVTSWSVSPTGTLTEIAHLGAERGLWISEPSALATVDLDGTSYLLIGAAGSSTLTVVRVERSGAMMVTDHVMDDLGSRFGGISALGVVSHEGGVYIVAGGSDDGLTLFRLLPGGRLLALSHIEDGTDMGLSNVSAIATRSVPGGIEVYVASSAEQGITRLFVATGAVGQVLVASGSAAKGAAGDDILMDGAGSETLTGGAGADYFVLAADGQTDTIADFELGVDRIDLSAWGMLRDVSQLVMVPTPTGIRISFGNETLIIHSADGRPIDPARLGNRDLINLTRIPTMARADIVINGTGGADLLRASASGDTIYGMGGNDTIIGGAGPDLLYGGTGADLLYGGFGTDTLSGGDGHDQLYGGDGEDLLLGEGGDDTIWGGAGNDRIEGGAGNDVMYGDQGEDAIFGGSGGDRLYGGAGKDRLYGGPGDDTLVGGDDADHLYGGEGDDLMLGDAGNDSLWGGPGNDRMEGGPGDDVMYGEAGEDALFGGSGADLLYGGTGVDRLYGGPGDDTLSGGDGDDQLFGGEGHDLMLGGNGNDSLWGGPGNDRMEGGADDDVMYGEEGDDVLFGAEGADRLYGGRGNDRLYGGAGHDTLVGGDGDDQLFGGEGHDLLLGGDGNDSLWGGAGDDRMEGGTGNDVMYGEDGEDVLFGAEGADRLYGGSGNDRLYGGAGHDTLVGGEGDDQLFGGDGDDLVLGDAGNDTLWGGAGHDRMEGGAGNDVLYGEDGDDALFGGDGEDRLYGGTGNDRLYGGAGHDTLVGGDGDDLLFGDDGDDMLFAGAGVDTLWGGAGSDVFVFLDLSDSLVGTPDVIADFQRGFDRIDLRSIDADPYLLGDQAFAFVGARPFSGIGVGSAAQLRYEVFQGYSLIEVDVDGDGLADMQIRLKGIDLLSADDFLL